MLSFKLSISNSILFLVTLLVPVSISAQPGDTKFEAGIQASVIGRGGSLFYDDDTSMGGGVRLTFNLAKYLALEGEMNYFPSSGFDRVRRLQGQFGIKSGIRFKNFGLFSKIRPGFQKTTYRYQIFCIPEDVLCPSRRIKVSDTGFALDLGGVLEFYPTKRIIVRFDVGDTIVNREEQSPFQDNRYYGLFFPLEHTTHTLQFGTGIGFRF
jgi:hypothetical protein